MIVVDSFAGKRVAVLGLARSGRAAVRSLAAGAAEVLAWDDNPSVREAVGAEFPLCDPSGIDWRGVAALVLSPGIPHSFPEPHPAVTQARDAGVEIIGDIELLGRAQPTRSYVGITGTNGKSTTTALIGHILRRRAGGCKSAAISAPRRCRWRRSAPTGLMCWRPARSNWS